MSDLPVAAFRTTPQDFVVDEIPLYAPSGAGEHLYVVFRKTGIATPDALRAMARALDVDVRGAGAAGMKDKRAVTTQAATLPFPIARGSADAAAAALAIEGIEVLSAARHAHKLKPGHLAGNRFAITLRGLTPEAAAAIARGVDASARRGVPNSFGPQRFGRDGDNPDRALAWLAGRERGPRDRNQQRFLVSALQSLLFNRVLARREAAGTWDAVLPGDLAKKGDFEAEAATPAAPDDRGVRHYGGLFLVPASGPELEAVQERARAGNVVATGPMFGAKMRWPEGEPAALERAVLREALGGDGEPDLESFRHLGEGTRRSLVLPVNGAIAEIVADSNGTAAVVARFVLPKGGYATTVLQRLCVLKEDRGGPIEADPEPAS